MLSWANLKQKSPITIRLSPTKIFLTSISFASRVVITGVAIITTIPFVLVSMPNIVAPFAPYKFSILRGRR